MAKLLRRPTRVACFYCNTQLDPKDPRNFRCSACGCWNRYDANGEIMSDEPAMHDEKLNARSFAKRASPRKDRLPTVYGQSMFCRTCQTNQMLISNLLSNYLPPPDDPEYTSRVEMLPSYRESVEARYPPVCADCLPAVEEEIKKRDQMARTSALGGFLKFSKGKGKQRQESLTHRPHEKTKPQLGMWRVRGFLWALSLVASLATHISVVAGRGIHLISRRYAYALPLLALSSITWTAWDPTYSSLQKAKLQGRDLRQQGRQAYIHLQLAAWLARLITSLCIAIPSLFPTFNMASAVPLWYSYFSLGVELIVLVICAAILRIAPPPAVRLVDSTTGRSSGLSSSSDRTSVPPPSRTTSPFTPPSTGDTDILASLSLSNHPVLTRAASLPANPIFGIPSFASSSSSPSSSALANGSAQDPNSSAMWVDNDGSPYDYDERDQDPNAMDWSPASPAKRSGRTNIYASDDTALLRPQRFFAPEEPTGLEHLFARTIKLEDADRARAPHGSRVKWREILPWLLAVMGLMVFAGAVGAGAWRWWDTRQRLRSLHAHYDNEL